MTKEQQEYILLHNNILDILGKNYSCDYCKKYVKKLYNIKRTDCEGCPVYSQSFSLD